ncbi:peptidase M48 [Amylibacter marinus]|uniref:Peptidase M48 n=1 Tax=Amylibacter marinus TaxID=1475483 RepID=A0ABQ5VYS7_9RHOB|nr:M48 family metalloprotease [Amylibacter marinus]GLQ36238.1 peptidase M48 [Amylibacter marinus]
METPAPSEPPKPTPDSDTRVGKFQYYQSHNSGLAAYNRVSARMRPVVVRVCKQHSQGLGANFCNFQFKVIDNPKQPPNAFQSLDAHGRPIITFNANILRAMKNDHEIGFIIGHEAGHQIARHLRQKRGNANAGAVIGIILAGATGVDVGVGMDLGGAIGARRYSQKFELEADRIGTYLAHLAGYDPIIGARAFPRIAGSGGGPLSTHPPSNARVATVHRANQEIKSGKPITSW